jgi:hypothetical protein
MFCILFFLKIICLHQRSAQGGQRLTERIGTIAVGTDTKVAVGRTLELDTLAIRLQQKSTELGILELSGQSDLE